MTSDILKRAAEVALLPCPFCGRAAHLRDDASHSTAAFIGCETEGCFGYMLWAETATDAAREWNQRPDMAAAIAERDAEIERLTARAEAADAETLEQARLLGMGAERELALMAKADRWERMADRLAEAMNDIRDYATILASDGQHRVLREVLAAHAAMKEGR